jgi:hypothetical protein
LPLSSKVVRFTNWAQFACRVPFRVLLTKETVLHLQAAA